LPGDRFIIRQFSPVVTIGGGVVLDATPTKRAAVENFLSLLVNGRPAEVLEARIARRGIAGISVAALVAETGMSWQSIDTLQADTLRCGEVVRIGDLLVQGRSLEALKLELIEKVGQFHKQNPLVGGISREQLREQGGIGAEIFNAVVNALVRSKKLELTGDLVRLPGRGVVLKDDEAESRKKIEEAFAAAGLKVPALHEVIASLKVDKVRAQKIVTLLLREKTLVKVSDELVFHRNALDELRRQIVAQKAKAATIDVAAFKQLTGVSRKYAIPLLEYLDRERLTKRVGDARQIL